MEPTKPLVLCTGCRGKWHPFCQKPVIPIVMGKYQQNWRCNRCTRGSKASVPAPPVSATSTVRNESGPSSISPKYLSKDAGKPPFYTCIYTCEVVGCNRPVINGGGNIFQKGTVVKRCVYHEKEDQHKKAAIKRPETTVNSGPSPKRPFNKARIYKRSRPSRLPGMQDGKSLSHGDRSSTYGDYDMGSMKVTTQMNQPRNASRSVFANDAHGAKSEAARQDLDQNSHQVLNSMTPPQRLREKIRESDTWSAERPKGGGNEEISLSEVHAKIKHDRLFRDVDKEFATLENNRSPVLERARISTTLNEPATLGTDDCVLMSVSEHQNPQLAERSEPLRLSPEYEPCPPQLHTVPNNLAPVAERDYSPGSQIEHELRAIQKTPELPPNNSSSSLSSVQTSDAADRSSAVEDQDVRSNISFSHEVEDIGMADVEDSLPIGTFVDAVSVTSDHRPEDSIENYDVPPILDHSFRTPVRQQKELVRQNISETERFKAAYMKKLMVEWGDDFHASLPWPESPGKTMLEHVLKIARTEKIPLRDFQSGITTIVKDRSAGKDAPKNLCIKLSDLKLFLAKFKERQEQEEQQEDYDDSSRQPSHGDHTKQHRGNAAHIWMAKESELELHPQPPIVLSSSTDHTKIDSKSRSVVDPSTAKQQIKTNSDQEQNTSGQNSFILGLETPNSSNQGNDIDTDMVIEPAASASSPSFLENTRQQRAASFDERAFDKFLSSQTYETPSNIHRQAWGHIDPRVKWPKQHDESWLEQKREEIEARGGRKANYGKILTSQIVKERRQKGWQIHQTKEVPARLQMGDGSKHMEALFTLPDPSSLEPVLRNGQLFMAEKTLDESGRKRRKSAMKVWPVTG